MCHTAIHSLCHHHSIDNFLYWLPSTLIGCHLLKLPHLFAADARSPVPSVPPVDGAGEGGVPTPLGPDKGGDKSLHSNVIAESTQMMMTQYNFTSREFFF